MSAVIEPTPSAERKPAAVPGENIWRFTVPEYHEMVRTGLLTEDDPVELLEGWLVVKMPKKPPHRLATQLTRQALERTVPPGWFVDSQEPVTTDDSEPEPDVTVVRGDPRHYAERHPGPEDVALVVEVADATLKRDQGLKLRVYAQAGLSVYWIVNLIDRQLEVYTQPSGPTEEPGYGSQQDFGPSDAVPVVIDGQEVAHVTVGDLLP